MIGRDGIDALFPMKPANLAYLAGHGRPCALALLTRTQHASLRCRDAIWPVCVARPQLCPKARVVPAAPVVSQLRMLEDAAEIDIAGEAELAMRKAGAEGWASPTHVASGWRSAMAHGPASSKPVAADAAKALRSYVEAREAGIAAAVPRAALMGIDENMAASLEREGYGGKFLRPVLHGVGIEHEEAPIPGGHAVIHGEQKIDQVMAGMVLGTGNCGICREDFGVRVEDTNWVAAEGPVSLTRYPWLPGASASVPSST